MRQRINKESAGFTLIEMMVSMAIGMVVIAGVTGTFTAQTRQNKAEELISQMHQNVRGAVDMIDRELMQAGYKASGGSVTGVTYNAAPQLLIQADIDGNGAIDPTNNTTLEIHHLCMGLGKYANNPAARDRRHAANRRG
jgi:prepilin-type N-terminal cleavage/methylation domain-containing protein